jgi:hypothetical protein
MMVVSYLTEQRHLRELENALAAAVTKLGLTVSRRS